MQLYVFEPAVEPKGLDVHSRLAITLDLGAHHLSSVMLLTCMVSFRAA